MLLGITGCSGTGVSTVSKIWQKHYQNVCSLDKIAHKFLDKTTVKKELEKGLSIEGLSKMTVTEIRSLLKDKAFSEPEILKTIDLCLHPRLQRWVSLKALKLKNQRTIFVLDAALIFELNLQKYFDIIVTVVDKQTRIIDRLIKRDGITSTVIKNRWKNQIDLKEKQKRSHFVIINNGSKKELENKAMIFYNEVLLRMEGANGTQNS